MCQSSERILYKTHTKQVIIFAAFSLNMWFGYNLNLCSVCLLSETRLQFDTHRPLSYVESPILENMIGENCLVFNMIRVNNFNWFRVSKNNTGQLTTLEYLNDVVFQHFWLPVKVQLPPGSYSLVFEQIAETTFESSVSSLAIDSIRINAGPCVEGKYHISLRPEFFLLVSLRENFFRFRVGGTKNK